MKYSYLSETVSIKKVSETPTLGSFSVEGLYTGYGVTLGNALRRALLSSLPGAAITQVKIHGVDHEFSTLPGMTEDIVEFLLKCHASAIKNNLHLKPDLFQWQLYKYNSNLY